MNTTVIIVSQCLVSSKGLATFKFKGVVTGEVVKGVYLDVSQVAAPVAGQEYLMHVQLGKKPIKRGILQGTALKIKKIY